MNSPVSRALVFSDLDGTLLDHDTYSFEPARTLLGQLERAGIPVIPTTSKTRAELMSLRQQLSNAHPFIAENGAAVYLPQGYFPDCPAGAVQRGGFWVYEISAGRGHYLDLLEQLAEEFPGEFDHFARAGVKGIAAMTGLSEEQAALANERE